MMQSRGGGAQLRPRKPAYWNWGICLRRDSSLVFDCNFWILGVLSV